MKAKLLSNDVMINEMQMIWLWLAVFTVGAANSSVAGYSYVGYPSWSSLKGQTDAHWTSNIPGCYTYTNDMMVWNTNTAQFWHLDGWRSAWKQDTNGWRVLIKCITNPPIGTLTVDIGSVTMDSGTNYYRVPDRKFVKFELLNSNGVVVPPRRGASMEGNYSPRVSLRNFPRWASAPLGYRLIFYSNGPPQRVGACNLLKDYQVKRAGDYTLTVCPVVYKPEADHTNFDRVDLPCVTVKIYVDPNAKFANPEDGRRFWNWIRQP